MSFEERLQNFSIHFDIDDSVELNGIVLRILMDQFYSFYNEMFFRFVQS